MFPRLVAVTLLFAAAAVVPCALAVNAPPRPAGLEQVRVTNVVDGDTLDVLLDGRTERLRLVGTQYM